MYMCLGQEEEADLCTPLRASEGDELLRRAILEGIARKPKGHDFVIGFFGGFIPTSVYLIGLMLVYGMHEGVRVFGLREHIIGRGIAVVVGCAAGGAQLRKKNPAQAAGFLVIGAIYLVSLVIGLATSR